jgi:hypothetical protein
MMGLEPTTFCIASGSWFRSSLGSNAHGRAEPRPREGRYGGRAIAFVCRRFIRGLAKGRVLRLNATCAQLARISF